MDDCVLGDFIKTQKLDNRIHCFYSVNCQLWKHKIFDNMAVCIEYYVNKYFMRKQKCVLKYLPNEDYNRVDNRLYLDVYNDGYIYLFFKKGQYVRISCRN